MKIIATCIPKYESDLIESNCRYMLTFCDAILLFDNYNIDNTMDIVQSMIKEGLNIIVFQPSLSKGGDFIDAREHIIEEMVNAAFQAYGADLVFIFDPDEFLFHVDGHNPRGELENLAEDCEYRFQWRNYIYQNDPVDNTGFLPAFFSEYQITPYPFYKTALSKYLFNRYSPSFETGNHALAFSNPSERGKIPMIKSEKLHLAHFPLRSKMQTMTKILTGKIQLWGLNYPPDNLVGFHLSDIYDNIMNTGMISESDVRQYSLYYAVQEEYHSTITSAAGGMPITHCAGDVRLKYTNYDANEAQRLFLLFLMDRVKKIIQGVHDQNDEKISLLKKEIESLTPRKLEKLLNRFFHFFRLK